ncbi:MAG: hypothetical protein N4A32_08715 [Marinifilaceae bacterium]|jgi:hypothetical protein|nr:hypothetical protein [Marinifilaceae bacterium]
MEEKNNQNSDNLNNETKTSTVVKEEEFKTIFDNRLFSFIFSLLIVFPLFSLLENKLPHFGLKATISAAIYILVFTLIINSLIKLLKPLLILGIVIGIGWIIYGSFTDGYSFSSLYSDYKSFVVDYSGGSSEIISDPENLKPNDVFDTLEKEIDLRKEFDYNYYKEYFTRMGDKPIIECFSAYKVISKKYRNSESSYSSFSSYPSYSSEVLEKSFAIEISRYINNKGIKARILITNKTMYPEICLGNEDNYESYDSLIKKKLFKNEILKNNIYYHRDYDDNIWILLSFNSRFPGLNIKNETVESIFYL